MCGRFSAFSHPIYFHRFRSRGLVPSSSIPIRTQNGSGWLASHFQLRSYTSYYFDSYRLPPFIPSIQSFIRRNCSVWDYNSVQLQGPTSSVCGKYCCLFALYMDKGYIPKKSSVSYYSDRRQAGFQYVRVWTATQDVWRTMQQP